MNLYLKVECKYVYICFVFCALLIDFEYLYLAKFLTVYWEGTGNMS